MLKRAEGGGRTCGRSGSGPQSTKMPFHEAIAAAKAEQSLPSYVRLRRSRERAAERRMRSEARTAGRRFAEFDLDGNQELDWDEFYAMLPRSMRDSHSAEDIKDWFEAADVDGNSTLSINEFWLWSMSAAAQDRGATALEDLLSRYDSDKTGMLSSEEFEKMANETGFAVGALDTFAKLCGKRAGKLSNHDLAEAIIKNASPVSPGSRNLLMALWGSAPGNDNELQEMEFSLNGLKDAASVRESLQRQLRESGSQVVDLVKLFDIDSDSTLSIDIMEFFNAMRTRFKFGGSFFIVEEVFKMMDTDGSGQIGFDELFEFVRGRRHSLDRRSRRARSMRCRVPAWAPYAFDMVAWDPDVVRAMLVQMMKLARISVTDLLSAWDRRGEGRIERTEFMENVKAFFSSVETLWHAAIEEPAGEAFDAMPWKLVLGKGGADFQIFVALKHLYEWFQVPESVDDIYVYTPPLMEGARRVRRRGLSKSQRDAAKRAEDALEAQMAKERAEARLAADMTSAKTRNSRIFLYDALRAVAKEAHEEQEAKQRPKGAVWELRSGLGWATAGRDPETLQGNRAKDRRSELLSMDLGLDDDLSDKKPTPSVASEEKLQQRGRPWTHNVGLELQQGRGFAAPWAPIGALPSRPNSAKFVSHLYIAPMPGESGLVHKSPRSPTGSLATSPKGSRAPSLPPTRPATASVRPAPGARPSTAPPRRKMLSRPASAAVLVAPKLQHPFGQSASDATIRIARAELEEMCKQISQIASS